MTSFFFTPAAAAPASSLITVSGDSDSDAGPVQLAPPSLSVSHQSYPAGHLAGRTVSSFSVTNTRLSRTGTLIMINISRLKIVIFLVRGAGSGT